MFEVRREEDDELCGLVVEHGARWVALTMFGGVLGEHERRDDAVEQVVGLGLASLAERWTLRNGRTGAEEVVCIQEASRSSVTVARGYSSMPGVPTLTITVDALRAGDWELRR